MDDKMSMTAPVSKAKMREGSANNKSLGVTIEANYTVGGNMIFLILSL